VAVVLLAELNAGALTRDGDLYKNLTIAGYPGPMGPESGNRQKSPFLPFKKFEGRSGSRKLRCESRAEVSVDFKGVFAIEYGRTRKDQGHTVQGEKQEYPSNA